MYGVHSAHMADLQGTGFHATKTCRVVDKSTNIKEQCKSW